MIRILAFALLCVGCAQPMTPATRIVQLPDPTPIPTPVSEVVRAEAVHPVQIARAEKPQIVPVPVDGIKAYALQKLRERGWEAQWEALDKLWTRESGWNPHAHNRGGRQAACGVPQRFPCNGLDELSPELQVEWGLSYLAIRYGGPAKAWAHSQRHGWY